MENEEITKVECKDEIIDTCPIEEKKTGLKDWISRHKKGLKMGAVIIASAVAGAIIHSKLACYDDDSDEEDPDDTSDWTDVDLGNGQVAAFATEEEPKKINTDEEA